MSNKKIDDIDFITEPNSNTYICHINSLSNDFKNIIRNNLIEICYGVYHKSSGTLKYKATLKSFLERLNTEKNNDTKENFSTWQMGMIGELLAHILIYYYKSSKLDKVSVLFNLEDSSFKKSFDIIFAEKENTNLWFVEVKSGKVSHTQKSQQKNQERINKAKEYLNQLFLSKKAYIWNNAKAHAKTNSKRTDAYKILLEIYDNHNNPKSYIRNAILTPVVFNTLDDKTDFDKTKGKRDKIDSEKIFNRTVIFSIQKETYSKVIDFLQEELKIEKRKLNIKTE